MDGYFQTARPPPAGAQPAIAARLPTVFLFATPRGFPARPVRELAGIRCRGFSPRAARVPVRKSWRASFRYSWQCRILRQDAPGLSSLAEARPNFMVNDEALYRGGRSSRYNFPHGR